MELDGKTLGTVLAALLAGGGSGFATVEVKTQVDLARIETRIGSLEQAFKDRVNEADKDHIQIRQQAATYFEQISERITTAVRSLEARIDRVDERKMDR